MLKGIQRTIRDQFSRFSYRDLVLTLTLITVIGSVIAVTIGISFKREIFQSHSMRGSVSEMIPIVLAEEDIREISITSELTPIYLRTQMRNQPLGGKIRYDYAELSDDRSKVELSYEKSGNTLRIHIHESNSTHDSYGEPKSLNYVTFYIPASYDHEITVKTESGGIEVDGRYQDVTCYSETGRISFNGGFETVEVRSESGFIRFTGHAKKSSLRSEWGGIYYDLRTALEGTADLSTEAGMIDIAIPRYEDVYYTLESEIGTIRHTEQPETIQYGKISVGNPDAKFVLHAKSEVGDIFVDYGRESSAADDYLNLPNQENESTPQYTTVNGTGSDSSDGESKNKDSYNPSHTTQKGRSN